MLVHSHMVMGIPDGENSNKRKSTKYFHVKKLCAKTGVMHNDTDPQTVLSSYVATLGMDVAPTMGHHLSSMHML